MTCDKCGNEFTITNSTKIYRRKNNLPNLCKLCTEENRREKISKHFNQLSKSDKDKLYNPRIENLKNYKINLSHDDRIKLNKKISNTHKEYWNNISDDEREKHSDSVKLGISKLSAENKRLQSMRISKAKKELFKDPDMRNRQSELAKLQWDSYDENKKKSIIELLYKNSIKSWDSLSSQERFNRILPMRKKSDEFWNNITPEERIRINNILSYKNTISWSNKTDKELEKYRQSKIEYWNNMTLEEFEAWNLKRSTGQGTAINKPKDTELQFINFLKSNNIKYQYQWYNKIKHESFDEKFPFNPTTGSDKISWQHSWDFIIHTNQKNILVDIDGSIHNVKPGNFIIDGIDRGEYIKFNDSQRPFQTDGYDAYIIEAYNDKIFDDTKVKNISTGDHITYKQFTDLLLFNNLNNKEIKKLIN